MKLFDTRRVCLVTVEEPSSPSDGSDNEMESDEGSDRLAASSAGDYVCIHCKSTSKQASTSFLLVNGCRT